MGNHWFKARMTADHAYKLLTADDWAAAEASGRTDAAVDRDDGYVHLSMAEQVGDTARLYFSGEEGAVLLEFALTDLGEVRWEASRGGALFPHLYGDLEIARATRRWTLTLDEDGAPVLPEDLRT